MWKDFNSSMQLRSTLFLDFYQVVVIRWRYSYACHGELKIRNLKLNLLIWREILCKKWKDFAHPIYFNVRKAWINCHHIISTNNFNIFTSKVKIWIMAKLKACFCSALCPNLFSLPSSVQALTRALAVGWVAHIVI